MPQIQFLDRVLDIPVVTQRRVLTVQIVQKTCKIPQVQRVAVDVPVTAARSSSSSPWQTAQKIVDFPQVQFSLGCGRPYAHAGSASDSVIDMVMTI